MNRRSFVRIASTGLLGTQISAIGGEIRRDGQLVLSNYDALRSYTGADKEIRISDSGLAGVFRQKSADGPAEDNGGTSIVDGMRRQWIRTDTGQIDFRWFGATGGLDDSASVQMALDAEKGKTFLLPKNFRCVIAGVKLDGAAYNGTRIVCEGEFFLKVRPSKTISNFGGAWVGLIIKDCDRVELRFRGDGQRNLQPDEEHVHLVGIAGATNIKIPSFFCREIRGDGLYVSQSNWLKKSPNTNGLTIGTFEAINTASDGRNGISIISADNVDLFEFRSNNIGGVVGGRRQPGGFDIEPNHPWHSCKNILVNNVEVSTEGTSGLAIQGVAGADVTRGVSVARAKIINTCAPGDSDRGGSKTQTPNHVLLILSASDIKVSSYAGSFTRAYGDAVVVSDARGVMIAGRVEHVRVGVRIGADAKDASGEGILDSEIKIDVSDVSRYGISTGKISRVRVSGRISNPVAGYYPGSLFGVHTMKYTQTDVVYSVSVTGSIDWDRSYRKDLTQPPVYLNVLIKDADLEGVWRGIDQQAGDMRVPVINVRGIANR